MKRLLLEQPTHQVWLETDTSESDQRDVLEGLNHFNFALSGNDHAEPLNIIVRDSGGAIVAGLLGMTYWKWLAINIFWVDQGWRSHGLGSTMIQAAEAEAVQRGCIGAHVDTITERAVQFYHRHRYIEFGRLIGLPPGQDRVYLHKRFNVDAADPS